MRTWFVVMIFGKLSMSIGPLPYGLAECEARKEEQMDAVRMTYEEKHLETDPDMVLDGRRIRMEDVTMACRESRGRPVD